MSYRPPTKFGQGHLILLIILIRVFYLGYTFSSKFDDMQFATLMLQYEVLWLCAALESIGRPCLNKTLVTSS